MIKLLIDLILFPFRLLFKLGMFSIALVGKSISLIIGIVIGLVGIVISTTIVGLVIGIPMMLMGFSIILSAIFG